MKLFFMVVILTFVATATLVVGVVSSTDINLAMCKEEKEKEEDGSPGELLPLQKSTETTGMGDFWTVPSSLMSDSSVDTRFRLLPPALLNCEDFHEFEIEIPQISVDHLDDGHDLDASNISTSEATIQIEIEFQNGQNQQEQPYENVTYFVTNAEDQAEGQRISSDSQHKPVATFTPTGYLIVGNEYFRPTEFCLKRISNETIGVKLCVPNCHSETSPCIPICCNLDKILYHNGSVEKCLQVGVRHPAEEDDQQQQKLAEYRPTLYRDVDHKLEAEAEEIVLPHFYKHMPQCEEDQILRSYPFRRIHNIPGAIVRILSTGRVMVFHPIPRKWVEYKDFCLAGLVTPSKETSENIGIADELLFFSGNEQDQILYVCGDYATNEVVAPHFYIPVFFINSFLLFLTAVVYIALWEKQNVHGWTVLSFVLAMFFMYIFLAWGYLMALFHQLEKVSPSFLCPFVGILTHFFFLATFCWLSVINFDLWWTFKSMAPVSGRSKGVKRFLCYMTFAWGTPAIIISIGLILSHIFWDPLTQVKIPGYGSVNCFLEPSAKGLYLYYIIGALMGINLIFMGLTLYTIYTFRKGTRAIDSARSNNSQSLSAKLFFKLFVVMGVTWIIEVISWSQSMKETILYWIVLDLFNLLQSGGVFFIFVCKRKILNQLETKFPSLKVIIGPLLKVVMSRRATRTVTTTTSGRDRTQTTAFSLRNKFQTNSSSKIKGVEIIIPQQQQATKK